MKPLPPATISLKPEEALGSDQACASRVVLHGVPSDTHVQGVVLEAALQWRDHYLLFTTDDVPFEDALHITLLDAQLHLLDAATLGGMYATGIFSLLGEEGESTIRFRFLGDTDWHVELLPHPQLRLPFLTELWGVSRPLSFSRHFIVRGNPQTA